jgi:hypothetical protein
LNSEAETEKEANGWRLETVEKMSDSKQNIVFGDYCQSLNVDSGEDCTVLILAFRSGDIFLPNSNSSIPNWTCCEWPQATDLLIANDEPKANIARKCE